MKKYKHNKWIKRLKTGRNIDNSFDQHNFQPRQDLKEKIKETKYKQI